MQYGKRTIHNEPRVENELTEKRRIGYAQSECTKVLSFLVFPDLVSSWNSFEEKNKPYIRVKMKLFVHQVNIYKCEYERKTDKDESTLRLNVQRLATTKTCVSCDLVNSRMHRWTWYKSSVTVFIRFITSPTTSTGMLQNVQTDRSHVLWSSLPVRRLKQACLNWPELNWTN